MQSNGATKKMHSLTVKTRLLGLAAVLAGALAVAPAAASAQPYGIASFSTSSSSTQAGAHADVTTSFAFNTDSLGNPVDQTKDVVVNLPSGVVGNPQAIPQCTDKDFQAFNCPVDSQVGVLNASFVTAPGSQTTLTAPNLAPTALTAALSPCNFISSSCESDISVASTAGMNSGDYLTIGTGAHAEHVTIAKILGPNDIQGSVTGDGLRFAHATGAPVYDDTIQVASTSGFEGYDGGNSITVGTGAGSETDTVAFAPGDATHLDLNDPLLKQHASGETVVHAASSATAAVPVFNLQPDPGHVATFAASLLIATIPIQIDVRKDGSYGLTATISDISTLLTLKSTSLTLWGVPGDPSHDSQRCGQLAQQCNTNGSGVTIEPFMTNPTNCSGGPLTSTLAVDSWQNPGAFSNASASQAAPTGCSELSFSPSLTVAPDTTQADTPAGYDVDLSVPQNPNPNGLATPDVQNVSVTLPAGTALSPAAANGLQGCTDAEFAAQSCPQGSKVGSITITSPLLPDHLIGSVWIGAPISGQMFRVFATAIADNVTINLTGEINPNSSNGQVVANFDQNPQLPFSDLNLHFFGGPLGVLANPEGCGNYTTQSTITPYGSPGAAGANPSSSFNIAGCGSPGQFAPSFTAGTTNASAGAFSPLTLTFSRQDTDQELSSIVATLPPGLLAKINGVPECSSANAAAGTCPADSQVGTATVGSGAGSHPIFLGGSVYLTGAYNGGQYGLSTVVPAIAGPYNLGTVVVRQALNIDPNDAHVTATSDPFPTILDGVPLRIKTINLDLNRPDFIVNPTSCNAFQVTAAIRSVSGGTAAVSSPFQVGSCLNLPFTPHLGINLTGKGQTTDGKHPALTATLTAPTSGQANLKSAAVRLPLSLALDPNNTKVVCSVAAAAAINCPSNTIVGTSSAVSPLLPDPFSGNVYLVQGERKNSRGQLIKTLPSLLVPLKGDIQLNLRANTSVDGRGRLITTFPAIPDAAVSNFRLTINGGKHGILVVTDNKNLCAGKQYGGATLGAQSGKSETSPVLLHSPCQGKHKKHKKHKKTTRRPRGQRR